MTVLSAVTVLDALLSTKRDAVQHWLTEAYQGKCPPFYLSLDLRHAGFKLAPVDSNLFPAGFNNLSADERQAASARIRTLLATHFPQATRVLIYPEAHTRNLYYLDNLVALKEILEQAGVEVQFGSVAPTYEVTSASGTTLVVAACQKKEGRLYAGTFAPDLIILNNDLTSGIPEVLEGIEQRVLPSPKLGWHTRRKSAHFTAYNLLAHQFAEEFGFDPWLISTFSGSCGQIDFKDRSGLECVAQNVAAMLPKIEAKYRQYGITEKPYIYVKSDHGTYGMGIMTVEKPEDIYEINKKERTKMQVGKGNISNTAVMLQEGVPTIDRVAEQTAESVIYCAGGAPIGLFFRTNREKDAYSNLNSPGGMGFSPGNALTLSPEYRAAAELIAKLVNIAVTREVY